MLDIKIYIQKINDLFVTKRDRYLQQLENGDYITCPNDNSEDKYVLNDIHIKNHLLHKSTYGILCDESTKFMMFDIDGNSLENAIHLKNMIKTQLMEMGFDSKYIHTEFSGKKGYHVYVFFEKRYSTEAINRLQKIVVNKVISNQYYDNSWGNIEIRPTPTMGIKLPLGVHQGSKSVCWFCDESDKPIEAFDYLLDIEKFPSNSMDAVFAKIKMNNYVDFELSKVLKNEKGTGTGISKENYLLGKEAFENGITEPHTRHNSLFAAALYQKTRCKSRDECYKKMSDWMARQDEKVITTPKGLWQKDVDKVIDDIYSNRYTTKISSFEPAFELPVTRELVRYIYATAKKEPRTTILIYLVMCQAKYSDELEDGGFWKSISQIEKESTSTENAAKTAPRILAQAGLIKREINKKSGNPAIKAGGLFGNPSAWYRLNDDLMNLLHQSLTTKTKPTVKITWGKPLHEQLNYALFELFERWEVQEIYKGKTFTKYEKEYKNYKREKMRQEMSGA